MTRTSSPSSSRAEVHRVLLPHHEHRHLGTGGAGRCGDVLDVCVDAAQCAVMKADGDAEPLHTPDMVPGCPMCRPASLG